MILCFKLLQNLGATVTVENAPVVQNADIVFLSVKPAVVPSALNEIKGIASGKLFISVAMGITIREMENVSTMLIIDNIFAGFLKYCHYQVHFTRV